MDYKGAWTDEEVSEAFRLVCDITEKVGELKAVLAGRGIYD